MGFLATRLLEASPQVMAACGETVTYGEGSITALWAPEQCIPEYFPDGEQYSDVGVLTVSTTDVASPQIGDTATIRSKAYCVKGIGQGSSLVPLQMVSMERKTSGHGNRRRT